MIKSVTSLAEGMLLLALQAFAQAPARMVAVTIDDLPFAQSGAEACAPETLHQLTDKLLTPVRAGHIPVTAFVIGRNCPQLTPAQRRAALQLWQAAGVELGSHTYSHPDLNRMPVQEFQQDILHNEPVLADVLNGKRPRYFRFPMLHTGPDTATKNQIATFLKERGYQQAPVTFDNSDWMFAYAYHGARVKGDTATADKVRQAYVPYLESVIAFFEHRSVEVVGREFPQILLLHANELNSEMLPDVLAMLKRRGYQFISLDRALSDPAYRLADDYAGKGGFSWIHRWSITKGMPKSGEPDEPEWIQQSYQRLQQQQAP